MGTYDGAERRKHVRFFKNYRLSFNFKNSPFKESDTTFIKDISTGGVRFTTSHLIKPGAQLVFEISIPYIAPKKLSLEGVVISSKEISARLSVYEIRVKFNALNEEAIEIFNIIEKQNLKETKPKGT